MFLDGKIIEDADPNTFVIIDTMYYEYAKDKSYVYKLGKKLEGVDPNTFVIP